MLVGSVPAVLSSLETRFKFSSIQLGMIVFIIDAAGLLSVIFVSYFGERGHKPRWLGASLVIQGIACLLFTLPQWIFGMYTPGSTGDLRELCFAEGSGGNETNVDCSSENYTALTLFLFANFILGIGITPLYTIGITFLDDIVRPKYVPIFLAVFDICLVLGIVIGFTISGMFLLVYVDPGVETQLTPTDPAWVGAWWLPFLVSGILSLLLSIPFFMFPRQLPSSAAIKEERRKEMAKVLEDDLTRDMDFKKAIKIFPRHLKQLISNPAYLFLAFAVAALYLLLNGVLEFYPKYFEAQFGLTASNASFLFSIITITGAGQL